MRFFFNFALQCISTWWGFFTLGTNVSVRDEVFFPLCSSTYQYVMKFFHFTHQCMCTWWGFFHFSHQSISTWWVFCTLRNNVSVYLSNKLYRRLRQRLRLCDEIPHFTQQCFCMWWDCLESSLDLDQDSTCNIYMKFSCICEYYALSTKSN